MRKRRILLLVGEEMDPPESIEGMPTEDYLNADWKCEYDIYASLKEMGHDVRKVSLYDELSVLREALAEHRPQICFNLLEDWGAVSLYDRNVVSYLELTGVRYTGCNPRGLMLARDKAVSKKLLAYHRVRVPQFAVFRRGRRIRRPKGLDFPLFVKSATEDASFGISQASLVRDDRGLAERVKFVHEHCGTDAIVEQFIDGRELYLGVIGNQRLEAFAVWELLFKNKPEDVPLIATRHAKWNPAYQKKWGVASKQAEDLPGGLAERIPRLAKRIYRWLFLSGYARIDFRLTADGQLYFLEANPNPQLAYGEDFAESAEKTGVSYERLLQRILSLGLRYRPVDV